MKKYLAVWLAAAVLLVWFCAGIGEGGWRNPLAEDPVLMQIRLPRIAAALLAGAALAASGSALQALFENPLADPSLIGTSGGAAMGVVSAIAFGWPVAVPAAAFIGAFAVCMIILAAHRLFGGGKLGLLVMGFVISALCGALVSLVLFLSDDMALRSAMTWLSGSFSEAGFISPLYAAAIMLAGFVILTACGRRLDYLLLGDEVAHTLGIHIGLTRILTVTGAALMTGAAVSLGGIIGFVGMMVPNVLAQTVGGGRTRLIALSAAAGSLFMLAADTFARRVVYPVDLPVGIVIAILGGPFFLWLIIREQKR
ncbi:iron ABC transporter permease [Neisseria leonii]|uniref:FecCD family ABC transporter permease n=1 Tax=Neisseria leonii TaxID=2995413 RepID=UPI0030D20AC5